LKNNLGNKYLKYFPKTDTREIIIDFISQKAFLVKND
jgi:hypothetical protein